MNGLWTAEFGSCAGVFSGGVLVFQNGTILGGDGGYFYTGEYSLTESDFKATILLSPFIDDFQSIFKTANQKLTLSLAGSLQPDGQVIAKGHPEEMNNLTFGVKFIKKAELAVKNS